MRAGADTTADAGDTGNNDPFSPGDTPDVAPNNPEPGLIVDERPAGADPGACSQELDSDITIPTVLTNGPAECDYRLVRNIEVNSLLSIEPGVVVRADADSGINVAGGEIQSVGTSTERITFEGMNHLPGYWDGIDFDRGRASRFESTDIADAGQECPIVFCADGAVIFDEVTISFVDSSVSNSYVFGMIISEDVLIEEFSNNRFFDNVYAGLAVDARHVPSLDSASNYSGGDQPNGSPYVDVSGRDLGEGVLHRWKALEAPYLISPFLTYTGGTLLLEPGVEMVFGEDAWLEIEGNATLTAVGTAEQPIVFRGLRDEPGYWDTVRFDESPWDTNVFDHAEFRNSGNTDGLVSGFGAIYLNGDSQVAIGNTAFVDNDRWAVNCSNSDFDETVVVLGPGNTFTNNATGDIDTECIVRQ
jgi:hypothetical protein